MQMTKPGLYWIARKHYVGAKKYETISIHKSKRAAISAAAKAMADDQTRRINRVDVLYTPYMSYYEPHVAYEMRRY